MYLMQGGIKQLNQLKYCLSQSCSFFQYNKVSEIQSFQKNMADKCYRVEFTAHLHKLMLALKMECEVEVIWKRGQKKAESGKIPLVKGEAQFNKNMTISCNMVYSTKQKTFKQKITKFTIILICEKGTKQAGEVQVDVSEFINEKKKDKKQYQKKLIGCPDKNATISFSLAATLKQQISMDQVSQSSYLNTQNPVLQPVNTNGNKNKEENKGENKGQNKGEREKEQREKIRLEQQNKKIRQDLKEVDKLKKKNEQLRKMVKNQQYKKVEQIKSMITKYKNEIEKIKSEIRKKKKIEEEKDQMQKNLLLSKVKIMRAFNYVAQFGGTQLLDQIQSYSGFEE